MSFHVVALYESRTGDRMPMGRGVVGCVEFLRDRVWVRLRMAGCITDRHDLHRYTNRSHAFNIYYVQVDGQLQ